ncbi:anaerobic ribonucleoside-triphosphate reductase [Eubacterium coprostanoligenes]|uniref:anaerobic ribonucleoside-triphosphate reductase n=2 Tax=Eubacterium coprostanoligenes TaxID=290054 RepID=UPI002A807CD7|nr:anaerobic ribonucleoside-triphosphate reductase [Eubacterium coprostanoligenes]MDY4698359.1 anaerobic ribonucleoside-triphosphate reductase [Eubacterium coprostanoligenes]
MKVLKRNGAEVSFDIDKIAAAITKANESVNEDERMTATQIDRIAESVEFSCVKMNRSPSVEEIQDLVEYQIMAHGAYEVAKSYITYRYTRSLVRQSNTTDEKIMSLIECNNEEAKQENSNKNPIVNSTQRDYMAGEVSKDITKRILLPEDIVEAHENGLIHFHDADYFAQHMHNCDLVNLEDMLQNGTVISDTMIEKPHSFSTACNIATQIIAQVASSQYGGQSISLAHLAPFVQISREKIRAQVIEEAKDFGGELTEEKIVKITEKRLRDEVSRGVQTIQYQVVTLLTTNGQAPFVTVFMYLNEAKNEQEKKDLALIIEETLRQRIKGVKNEKGVWITPAFPKLIYVLENDNINENTPFYYLTELAAKCTAKRMVPDYVSEKVMLNLKGDVYTPMGCRSFLTPDRFTEAGVGNIARAKNYVEGKKKYYGRFNQGVVTINLVDVACTSGGDMNKFWEVFDERLELCYRALMCRHNRLKGTLSDAAPILWQHGALARLDKGEPIDRLLYDGYSTISLGYAGLYECTKYMTGKSHTDENGGKEFALQVMRHMNDACAEWKAQTNIDFSIYGTPLESTTYKFAKCLQKRFGIIKGVTDKNYITNSYHVHVAEKIDAFTKLKFESEFQALSPGGAISYVEVPNMQDNIPAVIQVMKFIYDNIMYAELNTKSDYCQCCGYDGEIKIVEDEHGKLIWRCPNCGNEDQDKMNVARRTCGYIGTQFWNQGRTQEIKDRVLHL